MLILALRENLRLGRIFPAMVSTRPKGSQLAIAEPSAAYFTYTANLLGYRDEWKSLLRPSI